LLISRAGEDIAPSGDAVHTARGMVDVPSSGAVKVLELPGARILRALRFTVPIDSAVAFGRARLRITWDDRGAPSVDAPVALFFGTGTLFNRDGRAQLVKSFPMVIEQTSATVSLSTYFPMPFLRQARIELVGADAPIANVAWEARSIVDDAPPNHLGYFHA